MPIFFGGGGGGGGKQPQVTQIIHFQDKIINTVHTGVCRIFSDMKTCQPIIKTNKSIYKTNVCVCVCVHTIDLFVTE